MTKATMVTSMASRHVNCRERKRSYKFMGMPLRGVVCGFELRFQRVVCGVATLSAPAARCLRRGRVLGGAVTRIDRSPFEPFARSFYRESFSPAVLCGGRRALEGKGCYAPAAQTARCRRRQRGEAADNARFARSSTCLDRHPHLQKVHRRPHIVYPYDRRARAL